MDKLRFLKILDEMEKLNLNNLKKIAHLSPYQLKILTILKKMKQGYDLQKIIHLKGFEISRTQRYREITYLRKNKFCDITNQKIILNI